MSAKYKTRFTDSDGEVKESVIEIEFTDDLRFKGIDIRPEGEYPMEGKVDPEDESLTGTYTGSDGEKAGVMELSPTNNGYVGTYTRYEEDGNYTGKYTWTEI